MSLTNDLFILVRVAVDPEHILRTLVMTQERILDGMPVCTHKDIFQEPVHLLACLGGGAKVKHLKKANNHRKTKPATMELCGGKVTHS